MRASDEADYVWLFRAHFRGIAQAVNLIVVDRARAEEITQEAFVQLWRRWSTIRTYERPEAWLRKVAVRLALRTAQRDDRRTRLEPRTPTAAAPAFPDPDLAEAIRALAPRQRAAVVLFYLEDRPVAGDRRTARGVGVHGQTAPVPRPGPAGHALWARTKRRTTMSVDQHLREALGPQRRRLRTRRRSAISTPCCAGSVGGAGQAGRWRSRSPPPWSSAIVVAPRVGRPRTGRRTGEPSAAMDRPAGRPAVGSTRCLRRLARRALS